MLGAQKAALAIVKPGATHEDVEGTCARVQAEGLVKLGLLSGDPAELVKTMGHRKLTLHGVSHWVGLDVHDAGSYWAAGKPRPLEPGMVFTIEPGIYIPATYAGRGSQVVEHRRPASRTRSSSGRTARPSASPAARRARSRTWREAVRAGR